MILRALVLLLCLSVLPRQPHAQEAPPTTLIADVVEVTAADVLIASGNVEVFRGTQRLTATSITYDPGTEQLVFEGPLTLQDGDDTTIVASGGALDKDLRNGVLDSARMVLDQHLQLSSVQLNRTEGRFTQLYKTTASSCRICGDNSPPLWQIRAKRVIHDTEAQQLYFDNAQLRVLGVPVLYVPRLRLPDPTLDRATGFLIPRVQSNSLLGTGLKLPYFIKIGDHKDLTVTPYWSPQTKTVELRYRQAFRTGRIDFNGAISDDTLLPDENRYYLFGGGTFGLGRGYVLNFDIEATSDNDYLTQYGYSGKDRLDSAITVSRTSRNRYFQSGVILYDSLRSGEVQAFLPTVVADATYERRIFPERFGGEIRTSLAAHTHWRSSDSRVSGEGRDVTRIQGDAHWLRTAPIGGGLLLDTKLGFAFELFDTQQDETFEGQEARALPQAALALRYPLTKTTSEGVRHFLEPALQITWTGGNALNLANDESTRVDFDEGNLFALSRFPEVDRREHGAVLAAGLHWARFDPNGWESSLTVGKLYRGDAQDDFSATSGLDGVSSDTLVAGQIKSQSGWAFSGRGVFDEAFNFSKAEIRGDWAGPKGSLGGSYLWLIEDDDESRDNAISEITLLGSRRLHRHWTVSGSWAYDLEDNRTPNVGLGFGYRNECIQANLSLTTVFSTSSSVEPVTNIGFTIELLGFGAQTRDESYHRSCTSTAS